MRDWGDALESASSGISSQQLRTLLAGLRSDYLLAASLAGNLEGLRNVIAIAVASNPDVKTHLLQAKALGDPSDDLVYTPVTPCRLADTRNAGGQIGSNSSRDFKVWVSAGGFSAQGGSATNCDVPPDPAAVAINITAVAPAGAGNLIAYPTGSPTFTSALNYQSGQNALANGAIVRTCIPNCTNQLTIATNGAGSDVVIDISGYFRAPQGGGGGGGVTAVTASAPLASSGGTTPNISLSGGSVGQVLVGTAGAPSFTSSPSLGGNLGVTGNATINGNVGIGTASPASRLHIASGAGALPPRLESSGTTSFAAGWDFYLNGSPKGYVGVPDANAAFGPGEMILFGSVGTATSLWAKQTRAITIDVASGTSSPIVGVGIAPNAFARLYVDGGNRPAAVFGDSFSGYGVYGQSNSFPGVRGYSHDHFGVQGESTVTYGVDGFSSATAGVRGTSVNSSGVYGETAVSSLSAAGVYGRGTVAGAIGVTGEANVANAVGVFGVSASSGGFGVYARNNNGGRALYVDGPASQGLPFGGLVKAMLQVYLDGTIIRCFNGTTGSTTVPCGFSVSHPVEGNYTVDFGFQVDNRFTLHQSLNPFFPATYPCQTYIANYATNAITVGQVCHSSGTSGDLVPDSRGFFMLVF